MSKKTKKVKTASTDNTAMENHMRKEDITNSIVMGIREAFDSPILQSHVRAAVEEGVSNFLVQAFAGRKRKG